MFLEIHLSLSSVFELLLIYFRPQEHGTLLILVPRHLGQLWILGLEFLPPFVCHFDRIDYQLAILEGGEGSDIVYGSSFVPLLYAFEDTNVILRSLWIVEDLDVAGVAADEELVVAQLGAPVYLRDALVFW